MTPSIPHPPCPRCGKPVPADAPAGQCPSCLLAAVAVDTEPSPPAPSPGDWPSLDEVRAAFPDLEVDSEIGRGGMAIVFKARQMHLDRPVALKILAPWLAAEPGFAERFSREARVLARLNHPNIVTIHDFGQASRFFYLLMEYVDGVNLRQAMKAGRFAPTQALGLVPMICDALQYAHGEGVLHRDIKPDNILLDGRGRLKIADFGIAKLAGEAEPALHLTHSGMRLGTPAYMAPEQVEKPSDVDHRADIYSLGVVLYEMLTGELPLGRFAAPSEKSSVDARIDEIVFRTLEKERERRYQSAEEVKTRVEGLGQPPSPALPVAPANSGTSYRNSLNDPLSHKAVAGAVATGLSLCAVAVLVPTWTMPALRMSHGPMDPPPMGSPNALVLVLLIGILAVTAVSLISGILLGASGISDIRGCGGRRRGAGLAVFAALTWPLLILTGIGTGLSAKLGEALFDALFPLSGRGQLMAATVVLGLGLTLWLDVTIIRRVLRWARGEQRGGESLSSAAPSTVPTAATAATAAAATTPTTAAAAAEAPTVVESPPKTSALALAAGILTLISLMPLALIMGLLIYQTMEAGGRGLTMGGLGSAEILILVFVVGWPGLIGTILGLTAMGRIRDSRGRLGGAGWAVFGGMAWPVHVLLLLSWIVALGLARSQPGSGAGVFLLLLVFGLSVLLAVMAFRAGLSWTRGHPPALSSNRKSRWGLAIVGLVLTYVGLFWGMRGPRASHHSPISLPAAISGDFRVHEGQARIEINDLTQTTQWTQERPVNVQRLTFNMVATLTAHRRLVCELRHTPAGSQESTVRQLESSQLLTGELVGGETTIHRNFELELPEGSGQPALEDAYRQINENWRHRKRAVLLARPEPVFSVVLPDGSRFEAAFVLHAHPPPA